MDLDEVKKFVNGRGERVILMEKGTPIMVLLSYEDYKKISNGEDTQANLFDEANQYADENKERMENDLTLEDLPF